jgi:hypothetical protein
MFKRGRNIKRGFTPLKRHGASETNPETPIFYRGKNLRGGCAPLSRRTPLFINGAFKSPDIIGTLSSFLPPLRQRRGGHRG